MPEQSYFAGVGVAAASPGVMPGEGVAPVPGTGITGVAKGPPPLEDEPVLGDAGVVGDEAGAGEAAAPGVAAP